MASLREGIEKAQFQTPPATRIREVAKKFGLQPPISVLRVARLLKPQTLDWDTGSVGSGELVTANGHLHLTSTGFWKFSGEVIDSGNGATFAFVMIPKFVDTSGKILLFTKINKLSDDETLPFSKEGRDLWIARNWDAIRKRGFTWGLKASTEMGVGEIISVILPILTTGMATWGDANCNNDGSWTMEPGPNGSIAAICAIK